MDGFRLSVDLFRHFKEKCIMIYVKYNVGKCHLCYHHPRHPWTSLPHRETHWEFRKERYKLPFCTFTRQHGQL